MSNDVLAGLPAGTVAGELQDRLSPKVFERIGLAVVFAAQLNLVVQSHR